MLILSIKLTDEEVQLLADNLTPVLNTLTANERFTIRARFALPPFHKPRKLDEVAAALQLSRERVRQIEAKALRKLRHPMRLGLLFHNIADVWSDAMTKATSVSERQAEEYRKSVEEYNRREELRNKKENEARAAKQKEKDSKQVATIKTWLDNHDNDTWSNPGPGVWVKSQDVWIPITLYNALNTQRLDQKGNV